MKDLTTKNTEDTEVFSTGGGTEMATAESQPSSSGRTTPETDAAERMAFAGEYMVPTKVARRLERQRDEAIQERDEARRGLRLMAQNAELWKERAENAFGVKVADCIYDYDKKSAQLRDATFKARHLQDLTQEAWQEVEKIENQEESK